MARVVDELTFKVTLRWWFRPLAALIVAVNRQTGWRPSERAIKALCCRAVLVKRIMSEGIGVA